MNTIRASGLTGIELRGVLKNHYTTIKTWWFLLKKSGRFCKRKIGWKKRRDNFYVPSAQDKYEQMRDTQRMGRVFLNQLQLYFSPSRKCRVLNTHKRLHDTILQWLIRYRKYYILRVYIHHNNYIIRKKKIFFLFVDNAFYFIFMRFNLCVIILIYSYE